MAFLNFSVLSIGGLLVAIPIVLHLLMRKRPQHQLFPALRFLRQRQSTNRRQMRLQNWLLLFLRCAAIGLLALLMARPTVASGVAGDWIRALLIAALLPATLFGAILSANRQRTRLLAGLLGAVSLVLAGFLILFVRRAVTAAPHQMLGDQAAPVAAVFVFDTSTRMSYQQANTTRLQEACATARWLIEQLPADSEVAVLDTASHRGSFAIDIGAALNVIDSLEISHTGVSLPEVVASAIDLVRPREDKRREVYVMTDLTEAAWPDEAARSLASKLEQTPQTMVYVLDVGVELPRNLAIDGLTLVNDSLSVGQMLRIEAHVTHVIQRDHTGPAGSSVSVPAGEIALEPAVVPSRSGDEEREVIPSHFTLEVYLEEPDATRPVLVDGKIQWPESRLRQRVEVVLPPGGSQVIPLALSGFAQGTHHGYLAIQTQDGLSIDNRRDFVFEVREAWPILLVTGSGANAAYVRNVLEPVVWTNELHPGSRSGTDSGQTDADAGGNGSAFACDVVDAGQLTSLDLTNYAAIGLLDPNPQDEIFWQRLAQYVENGGGLAICLGRNAQPMPAFNQLAAELLPGQLQLQSRPAEGAELYLSARNLAHPLVAAFRPVEATIPWQNSPVFRHWLLTQLKPGAARVLDFTNSQAAIWEATLGRGRVLTMTTPLSDSKSDRATWNWLPTGESPIPFVILVNEMFSYLASHTSSALNVAVGNEATLATDSSRTVMPPLGDSPPVNRELGSEARVDDRLANSPAGSDASRGDTLTVGPGERYQLFTPNGDWQEVTSTGGLVHVAFTQVPGAYHLKPTTPGVRPLGFAAQLPATASQVQRMSMSAATERLHAWLGKDRFVLARGRTEIDRGIGQARVGRELFPLVALLLCATLGIEHLVSNRFYQATGTT